VFLRDSIEVLSRPTSSGATPEMKNCTLKILSSRAKLPFLIQNTVIWMNLMLCSIEKVQRGPCIPMG